MASLQFNQEIMLDSNIFKYEKRLHSHMNKFATDGSMILTEYFSQDIGETTVDRGLLDIESLYGKQSPLRFNHITNFPLLGFGQTNPENTDENIVEDVTVNGEAIIMPSTIVPQQNDCFIVKHLKMNALFQVTSVTYDSMKQDGFYKISYRLMETSSTAIESMKHQIVREYICDLDAVGPKVNPIIQKDDYDYKIRLNKIVDEMIDVYIGKYYNRRHNCFLFPYKGMRLFDLCGNMFVAKHSIMNHRNSTNVIMLHSKLNEPSEINLYNMSVYKWIERGADITEMQNFKYHLYDGTAYYDSTFAKWNESDIKVLIPADREFKTHNFISIFNDQQINIYNNAAAENNWPSNSEYERLIAMFCHGKISSYKDIPLSIGDSLIFLNDDKDLFFLTPIIIYIIRFVLQFE